MFIGLFNIKINSFVLPVFDHIIMNTWLFVFVFLACVLERLKVDITTLKFSNGFKYSSQKQFWLLEFIVPLDLLKFMVQFDTLIFFEDYFHVFFILPIKNGVNALHLCITYQLKFIKCFLSSLSLIWFFFIRSWFSSSLISWYFLFNFDICFEFSKN